jgi:hypothetical protein
VILEEAIPKRNSDELDTVDGAPLTVQGFLADVAAIKEGRAPTFVNVGLRYTEFQKLKDTEIKAEQEREKNGNFKQEI